MPLTSKLSDTCTLWSRLSSIQRVTSGCTSSTQLVSLPSGRQRGDSSTRPRRPPCCETEASTIQNKIIDQTVCVVAASPARSHWLSLPTNSCLRAKPTSMQAQASQPGWQVFLS